MMTLLTFKNFLDFGSYERLGHYGLLKISVLFYTVTLTLLLLAQFNFIHYIALRATPLKRGTLRATFKITLNYVFRGIKLSIVQSLRSGDKRQDPIIILCFVTLYVTYPACMLWLLWVVLTSGLGLFFLLLSFFKSYTHLKKHNNKKNKPRLKKTIFQYGGY